MSRIGFKHFWAAHGRGTLRAVSVPPLFFSSLPPLIPLSNLSIPLPFLFFFMRTVTFIPPCSPTATEVPASRQSLPRGCAIEELSFINDYITNTNQTKELLFLLLFLADPQERRWSIGGNRGSSHMVEI